MEPESTVTNLVGHYQYSNDPFHSAEDDELVDADSNDDAPHRPSSAEIFRGRAHDAEDDPESYGSVRIDPASPTVLRRHKLPRATASQPPRMRVPDLPTTTDRDIDGARYTTGLMDTPTSMQTYGNTGQLLGLTSPARACAPGTLPPPHELRQPSDSFQESHTVDDSFPQLERCGRRVPDARTMAGLPQSSSLNDRLLSGGRISPTPERLLNRVSTTESEWESAKSEVTDFDVLMRESMESYANTSTNNSQQRLSYPRHPMPPTSPLFAYGAQDHATHPPRMPVRQPPDEECAPYIHPETTACQPPKRPVDPQAIDFAEAGPSAQADTRSPVLPSWQSCIQNGDEALAKKILKDKLMQDSITGNLGTKGPKQDKDAKRADVKALEALRQKNPGAVRSAVGALVEQLQSPFASKFGFQEFSPTSPNANDTDGLLAHAATPAMGTPTANHNRLMGESARALTFSPTINSFTTTPEGTVFGSPYAPEG